MERIESLKNQIQELIDNSGVGGKGWKEYANKKVTGFTSYIKTYSNKCTRCGGVGDLNWMNPNISLPDFGICWQCDGSGKQAKYPVKSKMVIMPSWQDCLDNLRKFTELTNERNSVARKIKSMRRNSKKLAEKMSAGLERWKETIVENPSGDGWKFE